MDVRHEDVLIAAVLILVDLEAEADGHQFVSLILPLGGCYIVTLLRLRFLKPMKKG